MRTTSLPPARGVEVAQVAHVSPELLSIAPEASSGVVRLPLKIAVWPEDLPAMSIKDTGCSFSQRADGAEWLSLSGQDWTIIRVTDLKTGESLPLTPQTELGPGMLIAFMCSERATVVGYGSYESKQRYSSRLLARLPVGEGLPGDATICRTDHATKSGPGRITIAGDNRYTMLRGARLMKKDGQYYSFEYEPLDRIMRNFATVYDASEDLAVDVLQFREEAVVGGRLLGLARDGVCGLDLRASCGVNVLGIARLGSDGWAMNWLPTPDFSVLPGDLCLALPLRGASAARASAVLAPLPSAGITGGATLWQLETSPAKPLGKATSELNMALDVDIEVASLLPQSCFA